MYVKDPFKSKYQLLINGTEKVGIKKLKNSKAFIDYSQAIDDLFQNLEYYNPAMKRKTLKVFDDVIADMEAKSILSSIVTELLLRGRKLNIKRLKNAFQIHPTPILSLQRLLKMKLKIKF